MDTLHEGREGRLGAAGGADRAHGQTTDQPDEQEQREVAPHRRPNVAQKRYQPTRSNDRIPSALRTGGGTGDGARQAAPQPDQLDQLDQTPIPLATERAPEPEPGDPQEGAVHRSHPARGPPDLVRASSRGRCRAAIPLQSVPSATQGQGSQPDWLRVLPPPRPARLVSALGPVNRSRPGTRPGTRPGIRPRDPPHPPPDPPQAAEQGRLRLSAMEPVRVVLAEDNALLRQGVEKLIGQQDGLELVGTADDLPALLDLVERVGPDVVVTDIRMPPTGTDEGIQAAARLREHHPDIGVVVLSQYANPEYALALLSDGSSPPCLPAEGDHRRRRRAGQGHPDVAEGGSVVDPAVVDALVGASAPRRPSDLDRLTAREMETLAEMARGKNNAAIAAALFLSERAVEKHTNAIFSKLGLTEEEDVNRRVKAVLIYLAAQSGGSAGSSRVTPGRPGRPGSHHPGWVLAHCLGTTGRERIADDGLGPGAGRRRPGSLPHGGQGRGAPHGGLRRGGRGHQRGGGRRHGRRAPARRSSSWTSTCRA